MRRICRGFNFRPDMREEYSSLCSNDEPIENFLFGAGLNEKIKEVNESLKVSNQLNTMRFQPYNKDKCFF